MIFASVAAGRYLMIEDDQVVATIQRRYKPMGRVFWTDGYFISWKNGNPIEHFMTLNAIHQKYQFSNYAGYGKVLRKY